MKIRTAFVSNSSSSSFVVAWPKKPETIEETKGMMFADNYSIAFHTRNFLIISLHGAWDVLIPHIRISKH